MEVNPNSQQSAGTQSTSNNLGNIQRPGEYLRHVRLQKKYELADISLALNMPLRTLEALEKDEYTALPEATFIKGYYRTYARHLNVDASMIIQRFDEIYQNDTGFHAEHALNDSPIKIMGKLPGSNSGRNRKWLKRIVVLIVIALLIWVAMLAVQNWSNKKKQEQATANPSNVQVLSLNQDSDMSGDKLEIKISEPTSLSIIDSTGKVLAKGRQTQDLTLNGQTPFQIQLNDAKAVSLNLNGEAISLSPYTVNGKADFRLSR
ncbi:helix-turn-helix domain-containing protein [Acinetobacter rathckeae]|uniref:helix-turn-helix domain-containing protein n=1 Tax=Acinetobacter rathckeae TaxID=2605272 RepID=UPI0018A3055D|nr:RodZ domain-containing protein [Acinetobacter rathckeae]MBF7687815.1 helix-turn-helix domain-containing protein [Acinetobacter rathckeae]MBF7687962.1 helix-turn-helix domain-containing protein [Acinetobacter rathckeae]MBF7695985.1 helix-turn-helix domain-containing protein [Acinetobacter rathckeae]